MPKLGLPIYIQKKLYPMTFYNNYKGCAFIIISYYIYNL